MAGSENLGEGGLTHATTRVLVSVLACLHFHLRSSVIGADDHNEATAMVVEYGFFSAFEPLPARAARK